MAHSPGALLDRREIHHFHLFCGLGGGARGFNRGSTRVGNMGADFRCICGIDVDPASIRDFGRLAGVAGTLLDLSTASNLRLSTAARRRPAGVRRRPRTSPPPPVTSGRTSSSCRRHAKASRGC